MLPLQLHDLPFALDAFELDLVYLAQRAQDPALDWLAGEILRVGGR